MAKISYSTAVEKSRLIVARGAVLKSLSVYSSLGSAQFIRIYDLATTTVSGTPVAILPIAAGGSIQLDGVFDDVEFHNGILLANSTTGATFTAGADDCWFTATYE